MGPPPVPPSRSYRAWQSINYQPAVRSYEPTPLFARLSTGARVLEVGCGTGDVCLSLARRGHKVFGCDLNVNALARARTMATDLANPPRLFPADALHVLPVAGFEAVVLIRTLTCFPVLAEWRRLLDVVRQSIAPGGLIYIHDFAFDATLPAYRQRYLDAQTLGWRMGNFVVPDDSGDVSFIAHHHTPAERDEIARPYGTLFSETHSGVSMRGNACTMFEYVGRARV